MSVPIGQGGNVPPIFMKGDVHGNVSPNILEVMSSEHNKLCPDTQGKWITATTVVCCILMQILCVVSQKASASGGLSPPDPLPGLRPWTLLLDFRLPDRQSSFMSPNNSVRFLYKRFTHLLTSCIYK